MWVLSTLSLEGESCSLRRESISGGGLPSAFPSEPLPLALVLTIFHSSESACETPPLTILVQEKEEEEEEEGGGGGGGGEKWECRSK